MNFIVVFLSLIAVGSWGWTIIQIVKPEWFFRAEHEANLKRKRPWWYFLLGLAGLVCVAYIWTVAIRVNLISVWILTVVLTLGSLKGVGMVFFYQKFSGGVTVLVNKLKESKTSYASLVAGRAVLSIAAALGALYFSGAFGPLV